MTIEKEWVTVRGEGQPVVFIHGLILNRKIWSQQIDALSEEYKVISYDVRGHGDRGATDVDEYDVKLLADDLANIVNDLEQNPVICGHSMGGAIAITYAANNPDEVAGVATVGVTSSSSSGLLPTVLTKMYKGLIKTIGKSRVDQLTELVSGAFGEQSEAILASNQVSEEEYLKLCNLDLDAESLPLENVESPMLLVAGENEHGEVNPLADVGDEREVAVIDESGHNSYRESPEEFNSYLREFVESVSVSVE